MKFETGAPNLTTAFDDNVSFLRARPKAERVLAEYENFLKLSDPTDRPTDRPTVTLFSVLYLLNQATD